MYFGDALRVFGFAHMYYSVLAVTNFGGRFMRSELSPITEAVDVTMSEIGTSFTNNFIRKDVVRNKQDDVNRGPLVQEHMHPDEPSEIEPLEWKMPSTKNYDSVNSSASLQLAPLQLPGQIHGTELFVLDVILLPRENSFAVFTVGDQVPVRAKLLPEALESPIQNNTILVLEGRRQVVHAHIVKELYDLPVTLMNVSRPHTSKCDVLQPVTLDGNAAGASHVLICRVVGLDLQSEVVRHNLISFRLGPHVVGVSTNTLSAGRAYITIPRSYKQTKANEDTSPLTASVVYPLFGSKPKYLEETLAYHRAAGISHVYAGVFDEDDKGALREALQPHIAKGFVSLLELDKIANVSKRFTPCGKIGVQQPVHECQDRLKVIVLDWALYHAKSFDDLLMVLDYDELVVAHSGVTVTTAFQQILQNYSEKGSFRNALHDICYLRLCPFAVYANRSSQNGVGFSARGNISRAVDFPLMDAGRATYKQEPCTSGPCWSWDYCLDGGFQNIYPKSVSVTRTTYKMALHEGGSCAAVHGIAINPRENGTRQLKHFAHYVQVQRSDGVRLMHFSEQMNPGRFIPAKDHASQESSFKIWWEKFAASRAKLLSVLDAFWAI